MLRCLASALLLGALSFVGLASAQTGPGSNSTPPVAPVATNKAVLSEEAIAGYLRKIDPNVQISQLKNAQNITYTNHTVKLVRGDWNYVVQVQVFGERIFFVSDLGLTSNLANVPASAFQKLLETNWSIQPTFLALVAQKDGSKRMLASSGLSRTASLQQLEYGFNEFLGDIKSSYPAWKAVLDAAK